MQGVGCLTRRGVATGALGAQAGERRIAEVIKSGGFAHVRRAAQTPLNMVLEATWARPGPGAIVCAGGPSSQHQQP